MSNNLRLQVILQTIDKASAVLKKIQGGSTGAAQSLKATSDKLKELNKAQSNVTGYRQATIEVRKQQRALQELQAKVTAHTASLDHQRAAHVNIKAALNTSKHAYDKLTQAYMDGKDKSAEATRQIELARITLLSSQQAYERSLASVKKYKAQVKNTGDKVAQTSKQHSAATARLQGYKTQLDAAGISTSGLGNKSRSMRHEIDATSRSIDAQKDKLKALAERQRVLQATNDKYRKSLATAGKVGAVGVGMAAGGQVAARNLIGPIKTYSAHEDAMLGVARQVEGARNELGQLTPVYRAIENQVRSLSHELPIPTTKIAEMITAASRMEVPIAELRNFTRTVAMMATAFDAVPDEIAESMGKVAKNFKIPITQIEGLADAINYLDDNAISKGADIINFLNRTSGVVSTVAMSARNAAALGSTLLTLGDTPETASTATNAIVQKFAAATKGTKKFQSAMAEIGLKSKDVQMGMSKDATATIAKVIGAIAKLPESQRIGVMVELVGLEHSDTLAKLVDKPEELARQYALANAGRAQGSMGREFSARTDTQSAQGQMTSNRLFNLGAVIGETLAPALADLLRLVNPVVERLTQWVQANPGFVGGIMKVAIVISALTALVGFLLIPLALIAAKMVLVRFIFARFAMALPTILSMFSRLSGVFGMARTAIGWVSRAMLMMARTLLANPIILIIAAIAVAAFLIYKYWGPISEFFSGLWEGVKTIFNDSVAWVQQQGLRMYNAGADLMHGLADGITGALGAVKDSIVGAGSAAIGWFKEKLGIRSPSLVFMQAGANVSAGAALGITSGYASVRKAAAGLSLAAAGALPLASGAEPLRIDTRAPLSASAAAAPASAGGSQYSITINAAPGMDVQALARAVSAELDKRERQKRAAGRSSLSDLN